LGGFELAIAGITAVTFFTFAGCTASAGFTNTRLACAFWNWQNFSYCFEHPGSFLSLFS